MIVLRNLNGTITIKDKFDVIISRKTVEFETAWRNMGKNGVQKPWIPISFECFSCQHNSMYQISSKVVGPETALIRFQCSNCGVEDTDVMD